VEGGLNQGTEKRGWAGLVMGGMKSMLRATRQEKRTEQRGEEFGRGQNWRTDLLASVHHGGVSRLDVPA
jgi:hypothetical protein